MRKETVYKMIFDITRIMLFSVSCAVFAVPFLFLNGELCLNMPSNGKILLVLFIFMALFEVFDRLVDDYKSTVMRKVLVVIEVFVLFVLVTGVIFFILAGNSAAIAVTAIICAAGYYAVKFLRVGMILNEYYLG